MSIFNHDPSQSKFVVKSFSHSFSFDPGYGYSLQRLLSIEPPEAPPDFADFWQRRYRQALSCTASFTLGQSATHAGFKIFDIEYQSTDGFTIGGWLLEPENQVVEQCILVGHGYGGRSQPDFHFDIPKTAYLFPCFRGLSRSCCHGVSDQPNEHVLHGIDNPDRYILGGCVDDLWVGVTVMQALYPYAADHIAYMGISFGGGIGAMAVPWDARIKRVHLNVPTFGHQPLRLRLPTLGSGAAVTNYFQHHPGISRTLAYYDAAIAAGFAAQPLHMAAALFDPMVAPPGQFAVYNVWPAPKTLFVLDAGHFEYPAQAEQEQQLLQDLRLFFGIGANTA